MQAPQTPPNCPPGLEYLTQIDQLLVHQQTEVLEGQNRKELWRQMRSLRSAFTRPSHLSFDILSFEKPAEILKFTIKIIASMNGSIFERSPGSNSTEIHTSQLSVLIFYLTHAMVINVPQKNKNKSWFYKVTEVIWNRAPYYLIHSIMHCSAGRVLLWTQNHSSCECLQGVNKVHSRWLMRANACNVVF